jgi:hypothetical protein
LDPKGQASFYKHYKVLKESRHPLIHDPNVISTLKHVKASLINNMAQIAGSMAMEGDYAADEGWISSHNTKMQFVGGGEAWKEVSDWFDRTNPSKKVLADMIMIGEHGFYFVTRGRTANTNIGDGNGWDDKLFENFPKITEEAKAAEAQLAAMGDLNSRKSQMRRQELEKMGKPLAAEVNMNAVKKIALLAVELGPETDYFIKQYLLRHHDRPSGNPRPATLRQTVQQEQRNENAKIFHQNIAEFMQDAPFWNDPQFAFADKIAKVYA